MRTRLHAIGNRFAAYGDLDISALLALGFDTVEVRTAFSKPVIIDLHAASSGQVSQLIKDVQPALIFKGPAGTFTIAPAGIPDGTSNTAQETYLVGGIGLVLGLLGLFAIGKAVL